MPHAEPPDAACYSARLVAIIALFVTCLITANIMAVKLVSVAGLVLPAAIVIFPLSYIVGDILTEVYGYRLVRRVIWLGFVCNLVAVAALWLGPALPAAPIWDGQAAYERILGATPRLLAASFLAYLVGELANAIVLARLKVATRGRWLWLRTISSAVVSSASADRTRIPGTGWVGTGGLKLPHKRGAQYALRTL